MSCATCTTSAPCGCCAGVEAAPLASAFNRPGLARLRYRAGTHGSFFAAMSARLGSSAVRISDGAGNAQSLRPLLGLRTRATSDPAMALLDGWACVADVLSFYQDRNANEGYLRTAAERRSVLELARLVGYTLRPGVAASVYLAYTLDPKQAETALIPAGSMAQSVPGPDETAQTFETSEDLLARSSWNDLGVRRTIPQHITLDNVLATGTLYAKGANLNLARGDHLLLTFGVEKPVSILRIVDQAIGQFAQERSQIVLQPVPPGVAIATPLLRRLVLDLNALTISSTEGATLRAVEGAEQKLSDVELGIYSDPLMWTERIVVDADGDLIPAAQTLFDTFGKTVKQLIENLPSGPASTLTDPSVFVDALLKPRRLQVANTLQLPRSLQASFRPGSDAHAQLLLRFAPQLKDSFYTAWEQANVNGAEAELSTIHVLRTKAPLFGAGAQPLPTYTKEHELKNPSDWGDWALDTNERADAAYLDQADTSILPDSYAMVQVAVGDAIRRQVLRVVRADTGQRTAYGMSSKTTRLRFERNWWSGIQDSIATLRATLVYAGSEALALSEAPLDPVVQGQQFPLSTLHKELTSGRWLVFSGERADIDGVTGVRASELLMISGVVHDVDRSLPGDTTRTTVLLATPTAYAYKRDTLVIQANVVKATHGETRRETLGSGSGGALQSFVLRQPPLTHVAAPSAAGAASTLQLFIDDVAWNETATLADATPKQRSFVTRTGDDDRTTVVFGNGERGARVPSGTENVKAMYRQGIGAPGNVRAGQISLLLTRPAGVQAVQNPLRASGGADREDINQARENAPLAVTALDRLVSVQDYADFTRTFAGIAKASARRLSDGRHQLVHLTLAGANDAPIDADSDLYRNLLLALRRFGDPAMPVRVQMRELTVLVLSAGIALTPGYQWEPVALRVRAALLEQMGFAHRALGQPALLCEVIALIQNTEGVGWVNVTAFGGIPEKRSDDGGPRRLLTMDDIAETVEEITGPQPRVDPGVAQLDGGGIRPAGLAMFTSAVADTIILNQIKSPS